MTPTIFRTGAAALALAALTQPQIAAAQQCVEQQDLTDGVIYAMPLLTEAVQEKCRAELSANGFFALQGDAFAAPYRALQGETWPGAMRLLTLLAQSDNKDQSEGDDDFLMLMQALPEDAVRPFIDAIVVQKVGEEIKLEDCSKIERGAELLAPLPPENAGGLVTYILDLAGVDDPKLCPLREE